MTRFEYKVVPTSTRPPKIKGVRDPSERMRRAFEDLLNGLADQGWEYVRRDRVPLEAASGFLRRKELREDVVLIFRRPVSVSLAEQAAEDEARYGLEPSTRSVAAPAPSYAAAELGDARLPAHADEDGEARPEMHARAALRGERPTGAQPLFARRIEAAREAVRAKASPPISARRDEER